MYEISKILKEKRINNKITLKELSRLSNIPISTLCKIENNKIRNISSSFLFRLCEILKLDYEYLLRFKWEILPTYFFERKIF